MKDEVLAALERMTTEIRLGLKEGESLRIEITREKVNNGDSKAKVILVNENDTEDLTGKKLEQRVAKILIELGLTCNLKGYDYIKTAIILCYKDPSLIQAITKRLYLDIAKKYKTTNARVERAIRHAITRMWDCGNIDMLEDCFGYTINKEKGRPTNSEFIAQIVNGIRLNLI